MVSYFDLSHDKYAADWADCVKILKTDSFKNFYAADWADCVKILKTDSFKLSHHFAPNQLINLIPSLQ